MHRFCSHLHLLTTPSPHRQITTRFLLTKTTQRLVMALRLERALRITTLISNFIAFPLVIPAGIESHKVSPRWYTYRPDGITIYFGFFPLAFSLFGAALYLILNRGQKKEASPPKPHPLLWLVADVLIFAGYLTVLVVIWIQEPEWLHDSPQVLMFETYATMPYVVNL